jgi:ribulose-5-phosphate 4-epimerase/fuculose-1-phosphate aldolase
MVIDLLRLTGGIASDNAAGFAIHGAIHKLRPDIHAAAHSHTTYGRAFSVLGRNLDMASHGKFALITGEFCIVRLTPVQTPLLSRTL